jgi:hypothetical protein
VRDLYYMYPKAHHSMFLRTKQSIEGDCITYELRVARALMEDMRDITKFEGWFNVRGMYFREPFDAIVDWVELQPEGLAMQLLRLAYIAARHEEGPYGEPEELSKDTD